MPQKRNLFKKTPRFRVAFAKCRWCVLLFGGGARRVRAASTPHSRENLLSPSFVRRRSIASPSNRRDASTCAPPRRVAPTTSARNDTRRARRRIACGGAQSYFTNDSYDDPRRPTEATAAPSRVDEVGTQRCTPYSSTAGVQRRTVCCGRVTPTELDTARRNAPTWCAASFAHCACARAVADCSSVAVRPEPMVLEPRPGEGLGGAGAEAPAKIFFDFRHGKRKPMKRGVLEARPGEGLGGAGAEAPAKIF